MKHRTPPPNTISQENNEKPKSMGNIRDTKHTDTETNPIQLYTKIDHNSKIT